MRKNGPGASPFCVFYLVIASCLVLPVAGCDSGGTDRVEVSKEFQQKTQDMLKSMPDMQRQRQQEFAAAKKAAAAEAKQKRSP
jgi:hypothetical protein